MTEQTATIEPEIDSDKLTIFHPTKPGVQIELEYISPTRALQLLATNHQGQRNMSVSIVERYAADMGDGDWVFAGDPIRIDVDGVLVDGQHRLNAIVESDIGQWIIVVSGVDKSVMMAIDSGKRRSFSNQLQMEHFQRTGHNLRNPQQVGSVITRLWHWENGNYSVPRVGRVPNAQHLNSAPSHAQLFAVKTDIEARYNITFEAATAAGMSAARSRPGIFATSYGTLWVLLTPIDINLRERFFFELTNEDPDTVISAPMRALLNRLMRRGRNEEWPGWLQLHWLIQVATAMSHDQEAPSLRTPNTVRWDLLASLTDIKQNDTEGSEEN